KTIADLSKVVAQFFGIIETLEAKVDRLVRSELNSGFRNLEQACNSENERESLLREARNCFNKAINLEQGYRLGIALLALAVTHHHLGDAANAHAALEELVALPPAINTWTYLMTVFDDVHRLQPPGVTKTDEYAARIMTTINRSPEAKSLLVLQEAVGK